MALSPAEAAELYRAGQSACQIAAANKLTKAGVEAAVRKGGISGGVVWCPVERKLEVL